MVYRLCMQSINLLYCSYAMSLSPELTHTRHWNASAAVSQTMDSRWLTPCLLRLFVVNIFSLQKLFGEGYS